MEREVIQSVGFRNIKEDGKITGFQMKIRLPYYRGIFLSQLRPGTLFVDGERFEKEEIIWNIDGEDYSYEEMKSDYKTHWAVTKPAVIKVKKPGDLVKGIMILFMVFVLLLLICRRSCRIHWIRIRKVISFFRNLDIMSIKDDC